MKPEWGTKHKCPECDAHFYDMRKPEAVCPKCGTLANDKAALLAKISKIKPKAKPVIVDDIEDLDDIEVLDDDDLDADDDDDTFIEDTDDLVGSDESDLSEVYENIENHDNDMST